MFAEMMFGQPVVDAMRKDMERDGIETKLGIIQVGHVPESDSYVVQARKTIPTVSGISLDYRGLDESVSGEELRRVMRDLNDDDEVSGYMLLLPLPKGLQEKLDVVRTWITEDKDVDHLGFHQSGTLLYEKQPDQIVPPTPYAALKILQHYGVQTRGKMMAIVGDGEVGKRLKIMAGNDFANHMVLNETVEDLPQWTRQADIIVSAVGRPNLITADHVREGAVVVNVGGKFIDGKMHPDVDVEGVKQKASKVTPRIGGLGPVTVMALLQNVIRAARRKKQE